MNPMHPSYTPSTSLFTGAKNDLSEKAAHQRITSAAAPPAKRRLAINTSPTPPLTNKSKRTMQVYEEHHRKHKKQRAAARRAPILSRYNRRLAVLKHRRMGCPSNARMSKTAKSEGVGGLEGWTPIDRFDCINCLEMKGRKAPFQKFAQTRSSIPGGRGHSDLKTLKHRTRGGYKYIAILVDDCTRKRWVAFLRKKSDFLEELRKWMDELNSEGVHLRVLRSDNGGEYIDGNCKAYLNSIGCAQELSPPYASQANGVAEKSWSDLLAMARCILHDQQKDKQWWGVAVQFATYITNHLRTTAVDDVPPQAAWSNMPIDVSHFRVPLCTCWYYEEIENREDKSLSQVRRKATFVGYATDSPAYLVKDAITGIIYRRRYEDVVMDERTLNSNNADHEKGRASDDEAPLEMIEFEPSSSSSSSTRTIENGHRPMIGEVGSNVDSNETVSLDGNLEGKQFLRLSVDTSVNGICKIFKCKAKEYLQFISSEYTGNWTDKLNSKSVLVAGTDVPIYIAPQSLAAKLTAPRKVRLKRRLKVGRHAATVHHCRIEDEYQAIFDNAIDDAMRYESDAKHSYYNAMNAYITKTPVQHTVIPTPKNRRAAQAGSHWERWQAAEQREWQGLWAMGTFEDCKLEHLPKGQKLHFLNWIYKCKLDKDKARLTLDGRRQDPNTYSEIYAPTAKMASLRIMLAIAAKCKWPVYGDDVSQAFLYAERPKDKPMWCSYPAGHRKQGHCLRLHKMIYGLKDSPIEFFKLVRAHMTDPNGQGFEQSKTDRCLFIKKVLKTSKGPSVGANYRPTTTTASDGVLDDKYHYCFVRVHVDDFLIAGDPHLVADMRTRLRKRFAVTGEEAHMHYGLDIDRTDTTVTLSARSYLARKLTELGLDKVPMYNTPMSPHTNLPKQEGPCSDPELHSRYRSMVGALSFPAQSCRPDIAVATHLLSKHLMHPTQEHMSAAERVFGYLRKTATDGIIFGNDDKLTFYGTSDASHAIVQEVANWHPTLGVTGYHFQLFGGPVTWRSSTQRLTSHSSTESELYALDEATRELVHLQKLLKDFDVQHLPRPVTIGQDNLSAISLSHAKAYNPRTKHIAIRYMYVNQIQEQGEVLIKHLSTDSIPSGALTKPLHGAPFKLHTDVLMGRLPLQWISKAKTVVSKEGVCYDTAT